MTRFAEVPVEAVQQYWDARPCNIRHSGAAVGTRLYFDEVEARKYLVEPHIPAFADFGRWAGKRVLEVGCGIGTDTVNFARVGAQVTAVDLSGESIRIARQRTELYGVAKQVQFVQADAEHLREALEAQTFDLIYSFGVLHHTPHPSRALEQLRAFAGPTTCLKVMVYNRRSWKVAGILLAGGGRFWQLDRLIADSSEAQTGCPVTYTYTVRSASEWLKSAGFHLDHAEVDHIFPYRIPEYVEYRYVKKWIFRLMPAPVFRTLEHHLGWHLLIEGSPV